jgi:hypothetical protein
MKKNKKLSENVINYLESATRFWIHDCCDAMHEMESYENRFNALADDKFDIHEYVKKFHLKEYANAIKSAAADAGDKPDDWKEYMEDTPSKLPIDYDTIKELL